MRERVVKYLGYYVLMVGVLLLVRFMTRGSEMELNSLSNQADSLVTERAMLRRQIDSLESPARVREWAVKNNMVPFTTIPTETQSLKPLQASPDPKPVKIKLKVDTQWR